jgi:hypothetical protein
MSEPVSSGNANELQFKTAEPTSSEAATSGNTQTCVMCHQPIADQYYALEGALVCPECRERVAAPPGGNKATRLLKAFFFGLGAGLVGALIWFLIRRFMHLEIGLVAIVVGFMVGKAVRVGSGNVGGLAYQIMAVLLTYGCITANYMPDVFEAALNAARVKWAAEDKAAAEAPAVAQPGEADPSVPQAVVAKPAAEKPSFGSALVALATILAVVFWVSLQIPFMGGSESIIGLLIIGFALWEAWKFNARKEIPLTGPYQLKPQPSS